MNKWKVMKRMMLLMAVIIYSSMTFAQNLSQNIRISSDPNLIRTLNTAGAEISGNPFLFDDWKNVTVVFTDNSFQQMQADIKYNVIANEILVKQNGVEGVFREDIKSFILKENNKISEFRKGFSGSGLKNNVFVEVITDGSMKFIKYIEKVIIESKGYNTGTVEKKVDQSSRYYLANNNMAKEIKLNEKSIFEALKSPEAKAYVKANKLNLKKEEDVASLMRNVIK